MAASAIARLVEYFTLGCICLLASSIRLFSVIKYESVIHEFDPYFNYRVTQFLSKEGLYNLWNWFDDRTWYPLGRVVGGTVYPGLIFTAGLIYKTLHALNIPIDVQEACVFTAPLFAAFCALSTYMLVKEVRGSGAGLCAAAFVAVVPSYISRSVAGSFDNEGVAIFALVNTFFLYIKTLHTGSLAWATALFFGYLYMVASWGGYSFVINLIPIHCLASIVTGRLSSRLYVAYAPFVIMGTLAAGLIPVIGFNAVATSEHFASFFVLIALHIAMLVSYIKSLLPPKAYAAAKTLLLTAGVACVAAVSVLMVGWVAASPTLRWTGRSLSLLDPTYASKYIPIIASVSEHQPTAWNSYFMDTHLLVLLAPAGLISAFFPLTDGSLFLLLYGVTAVYFSGVMVRLMLVLAPALCCLGGVALHDALRVCGTSYALGVSGDVEYSPAVGEVSSDEVGGGEGGDKGSDKGGVEATPSRSSGKKQQLYALPKDVGILTSILLLVFLIFYIIHCCWAAAEMYSAPSIVLQARQRDGSVVVFDDFREAYGWLRFNSHPDAKVASWWDYGYQLTAMANRSVIVDNNTWNNTHIATVGRAMSSPEKTAWEVYRSLDVEYVLVVFGGWIGYPSDDINKFLWMVRIGGGVFPDIQEKNYLTPQGAYRVDAEAGRGLTNSLMYRLSYYRFADAATMVTGKRGFDRVRNTEIGLQDFKLKYFEEVFTSQHWMVRIYRVLPEAKRAAKLPNVHRHKVAKRKGKSKRH